MFLLINLALESQKTVSIPYTSSTIADEVCIAICTHLNIGPSARHIFALRASSKNFLHPTATFWDTTTSLEFRVRFKVASLAKLKKLDSNAFEYYYHQTRLDVIDCNVPDIVYEKHRAELLGLAITDMFRVVIEKGVSVEAVEQDYRKFVPKVLLKKHRFFVKKPIRKNLVDLYKTMKDKPFSADFLKSQYLSEVDLIAPEYLCETFRALIDVNGRSCFIVVKVTPPHVPNSGVKYCWESKKNLQNWIHMCNIEELGFVTTRDDASIEITRLNGIPIYIKFHKLSEMWSFISLLHGYYRLTCKWTFALCQSLITPAMTRLHSMKCHGPVGGEFSYAKLEIKGNNQVGCYIIRESETSFNSYYIDVCVKDRLSSTPKTFKLTRLQNDQYIFNNDLEPYNSLNQLVDAYSQPEGAIYLKECIYPSEYDISPLLLCRKENMVGESLTESSLLPELNLKNPVCINFKDLQVYKGQRKDGLRNITHVYRGMWKVIREKKIEIALKFLKQDQEKHLKSYLSLTGQWTFVKSPFIVRFYGIALQSNDVSIVMEYFKLGPLDQYLRHNQRIIKTVDLIEATSQLASAIWHLRENDIVHGRIRCRKLMVHAHDDSCFTVKLADNAVQTCYNASEVHWIAVECYTSEKRTAAADVWAMATTIYEMFAYGRKFPTGDYAKMMNRYLNGDRLLRPAGCPEEIYTLLTECWQADPKTRKQAQEVSREVNHLLYQVYNSRKNHAYDVVGRTAANHDLSSSDHKISDLVSVGDLDDTSTARCSNSLFGASSQQWALNSDGCDESRDLSHLLSNLTVSTLASSEDSLTSVQSIFELDDSHAVVLKGCIGQGNFGQVFKGILESYGDNSFEPIMVAVKKVKGSTLSSVEDFEREINIMKGLKHPNIVHILGVLRDPDLQLVMEYVPDGCLQAHLKHKKDELQIPLLLKYATDIAQGMDYLGTKNIVHRDLAARNILVVERSHVKISDFGLAQFIGSDEYYTVRNRNRELPLKWYAPENFGYNGKFSVRSDVWSYGVTLYEMFAYGDSPPELGNLDSAPESQEQASLQKSMLDAIYRGARYPCPEHCPQTVYFNIIKPCWELDPHARPAFKDLIVEVDKLKSHY